MFVRKIVLGRVLFEVLARENFDTAIRIKTSFDSSDRLDKKADLIIVLMDVAVIDDMSTRLLIFSVG